MGAFILAFLVLAAGLALAFFVGFAEGMATAPQYDNKPLWIAGFGLFLAVLIAASHWLPHIGW